MRFTKDVDLVLSLDRANALSALRALGSLGHRPIVTVLKLEDFADPE